MPAADRWRMRDHRDSEEFWKTIQAVPLEKTFLLFDTTKNYTSIRISDNHVFESIKSHIRLETGLINTLNVSISATPHIIERYSVITPFNRALGYPLDKDDLAARSRLLKLSKLKQELAESLEGMYLFVYVAYQDMPLHSMMKSFLKDGSRTPTREVDLLLRHLFLTLTFPDGSSFTARAWANTNRLFLLFDRFFPSDTGPLPKVGNTTLPASKTGTGPTTENGEDRSEGFHLLLPFELEKLKTIKAKFLYLPGLD